MHVGGDLGVTTAAGRAGVQALIDKPRQALLAVDFDGTLAPIVADPDAARAHPRAVPVLARLAEQLGTVAVVTGRPAAVAVKYGGFAGAAGLEGLVVLGQYGLERWDAATGRVTGGEPPPGLARVREELPALLADAGLASAAVEDKGSALAVHVRRLPDPSTALERLRQPMADLAGRAGLRLEPGRMVLEIRAADVDKGAAMRSLLDETAATVVGYVGDDLGDLAAFDAVDEARAGGVPGLLVCSGSTEQTALVERADVTVAGPDGVIALLTRLADLIGGRQG